MRYRLIDPAGSELGVVEDHRPEVGVDDMVGTPDGVDAPVVEAYDDECGREGDVVATPRG